MNAQSIESESEEGGLLPVATLVLWFGCLAVGVAGLRLRYPRPRPAEKPQAPVVAQIMHVELTNDTSPPPPDVGPPDTPPQELAALPLAMPDAPVAPPAPALMAVATPSPAISFALPTDGPARIVEPKTAVPARPPTNAATMTSSQNHGAAPPTPQRLTYGQGEGRQPAPEYPREAAMAHQQGTIVVRFSVGEDGRVQNAQAITPCPYALLNQAAVRAVRENWRFRTGVARTFEVSIEFQLKQH